MAGGTTEGVKLPSLAAKIAGGRRWLLRVPPGMPGIPIGVEIRVEGTVHRCGVKHTRCSGRGNPLSVKGGSRLCGGTRIVSALDMLGSRLKGGEFSPIGGCYSRREFLGRGGILAFCPSYHLLPNILILGRLL